MGESNRRKGVRFKIVVCDSAGVYKDLADFRTEVEQMTRTYYLPVDLESVVELPKRKKDALK